MKITFYFSILELSIKTVDSTWPDSMLLHSPKFYKSPSSTKWDSCQASKYEPWEPDKSPAWPSWWPLLPARQETLGQDCLSSPCVPDGMAPVALRGLCLPWKVLSACLLNRGLCHQEEPSKPDLVTPDLSDFSPGSFPWGCVFLDGLEWENPSRPWKLGALAA